MARPWVDQPYNLISVPIESSEVCSFFLFPTSATYILESKESSSLTSSSQISKEVQHVVTEMCLAHNIFIRNMNAIVLQCTHISVPTDISDFLTFCKAFHVALHHHHWGEEEFFFPEVEEYTKHTGLMEVNVTQHAAFEEGLKKFNDYVTTVSVAEYDGGKLKGLLEGFAGTLVQHLKEEIQTLLGLEKYGGKEIAVAWKHLEDKVMRQMGDKVRFLLPYLSFISGILISRKGLC